METLTRVDLDLQAMRRVVERESGCIVWGGAIHLSPVDDLLIRVERALDLDSDAQLVASVLSKKVAAGSTHVVIDIPVGPTAKIRTPDAAHTVARLLERVGHEVGLVVRPVVTDGSQPIGRGIGPALEARDVVAVTRGDRDAPHDLTERAILLAGELLELAGACAKGTGSRRAPCSTAPAWRKLQAISARRRAGCAPPASTQQFEVIAPASGSITRFDCRKLARAAKLAGAPADPAAGIDLHVRLGQGVESGQPLFTLHAESPGELAYAREYLTAHADVVVIGPAQ
jgi:thymidine phosphorylase